MRLMTCQSSVELVVNMLNMSCGFNVAHVTCGFIGTVLASLPSMMISFVLLVCRPFFFCRHCLNTFFLILKRMSVLCFVTNVIGHFNFNCLTMQ